MRSGDAAAAPPRCCWPEPAARSPQPAARPLSPPRGLPCGLRSPPPAAQRHCSPPRPGAGGDHGPAGEAQWVPHAGRLPWGRCGRSGGGGREPPAAHEGDGPVPAEAAAAWQPHAGQRRQQRRLLRRRLGPLRRRRPAHRLAQYQPHAWRRECGGAHQPHGGHADERVRDVHTRHQPHARRRARGSREPPTAAAPAAAAGHCVVAQLVAHPPVD